MVSKDVTMRILLDDTDVTDKLSKNQEAIDAQAAEWRSKRNQILLEMHSINMGISMMMQSIRMVVRITGQAIDPIHNALFSMITSTVSLMVATATALASTGIMAGAAVVLAALAFSFQAAQTARMMEAHEKFKGDFAAINRRLAQMEGPRFTMGRTF